MATKTSGTDIREIEVRIRNKRYYKDGYGIFEAEILSDGEGDVVDGKNDNTLSIYRGFGETTIVKGSFDKELLPLEEYTMYGAKEYNQKYKSVQWTITAVKNKLNTPNQIRSFLLACTKNEKVVDQLMKVYGDSVIDDIEHELVDPEKIVGLGIKTLENLREKVLENMYLKEIIAELSQYDVTPNQMKKIMLKFGANAVNVVRENPYNLCKINGIGFKKADQIAKKMGIDPESPFRIYECIRYVILTQQNQGHTWVSINDMINMSMKEMKGDVSEKLVFDQIAKIESTDILEAEMVVIGDRIALKRTYDAEKFIADKLVEHLNNSKPLSIDVDKYVAELREKYPTITDEQIQLFYNFAKYNVNFLVGYAGCGKSWVTKLLIDMTKGKNVLLLAPTGKAAKVMEGYCGVPASTIHRAIGVFNPSEDEEDGDSNNELYDDIVDIDESSMNDVFIVTKLLKALKNPEVRILFIGDDFQIPSVGAGNFLYDCKVSNRFPITQLTKVFRQEKGGILDIATKVRENIKFIDDSFKLNLSVDDERLNFGHDMVIHPCSSEYILEGTLTYYEKALEKYAQEDVVVVTPKKIGKSGTQVLNKKIQEIVNPYSLDRKQVKWGKDDDSAVFFRVGDRVMNIQNNYKAVNVFDQEVTVFNGEVGVIKDIDLDKGDIIIDYGFDEIKTGRNSLSTIVHAYALTIHKSQGSGFKCVIMVTDSGDTFMLNANLIYTGITRSKEMMYWLCQPNIINHAMNENIPDVRNTFLKDLLRQASRKSAVIPAQIEKCS